MKLTFPSGLVGVIHSSKISPEKRRKLTIVGSKDSVIYDDTAEKKVIVYKGMGPTTRGKTIIPNQPQALFPAYSSEMSLTEELKAFLKMVRTKKAPKTGALDGLEVVAILEAAEKSISLGGKLVRIKR